MSITPESVLPEPVSNVSNAVMSLDAPHQEVIQEPGREPGQEPSQEALAPEPVAAAPADAELAADRPARADRGRRSGGGRGSSPGRAADGSRAAPRPAAPGNPVLAQLASWYPALFGAEAVPMKRGIFHELMAAHPDALDKEALKQALSQYTRSTRYLTAVAAGYQRHDLTGQPVEAVAPEHVYHALLETLRRRHARTGEDVRGKLHARIVQAAEASGWSPADYAVRVRNKDEAANAILDNAMAELGARVAKDEALLQAFEASGKTVNTFADMYGLHALEAAATLNRAKVRRAAVLAAAQAPALSLQNDGD
jgi:ProP effector